MSFYGEFSHCPITMSLINFEGVPGLSSNVLQKVRIVLRFYIGIFNMTATRVILNKEGIHLSRKSRSSILIY